VDLATAQRLMSAADPKALSALKNQPNDPVAARVVAGQFAALLIENVMQGSDGAALPVAGDETGSNIVSGMFATAISQAAASDGKLGLADMLFRAIEAKQQAAEGHGEPKAHPPTSRAARHGRNPSLHGFPLRPYWQDHGLRPFTPGAPPPPVGLRPALRPGTRAETPPRGATAMVASTSASAPANARTRAPSGSTGISPDQPVSAQQVQSFARQLRPMLAAAGRQLGVSPKILLAHAALETGWGRSVVGNNLFGIKADPLWQGPEVTTMTHEVEDGERVTREAAFRSYPSLDASVRDYVALIGGNPRYQGLIGLGDNVEAYARGLVAGGYATDTDYQSKLEAIAAEAKAAFTTPSDGTPPLWGLFTSLGSME
jgi:peptidoglycan hydrolase FlgJ